MTISTKLKVSLLHVPFLTDINNTLTGYERVSGFDGDFLNIIAEHLGFEYDIITPKDGQWGRKKNDGNWSGLIGQVAREEADMAVGAITVNTERAKVVDFSTMYSMEEMNFIMEKPYYSERPLFAYLYTFDATVWVCFILAIAVIAAVFYRLSEKKLTYGDILLKLYASVVRQPIKMNYLLSKGKLLILFWLFFVLVISVGYSAKLLSFLTVPLKKIPVQNFYELFRAIRRGTYKCFAYKYSDVMEFLKFSNSSYLKTLRNIISKNDWYIDNYESPHKSVINQNSGVIKGRLEFIMFYGATGFKSRYMRFEEPLVVWPVAIAFSKSFCCKSEINTVISRLISAGIHNKLLNDVALKLRLKDYEEIIEREITTAKLTIDDILGPLLLLITGYAVSIIILFGEILYCYWSKRKGNLSTNK